ncbi:FtsK/SpoIIIE domain-containing protein [Nocardia sp. NPDC051570]|uniref:FtsK/SpoIIIE domain-containing protein n=1 Tax=Nocardia sp. NPDC051570 TaxID=3364324 RepID=UPI003797F7C6
MSDPDPTVDFASLHGIGDISGLDVSQRRRIGSGNRLSVAIGVTENGSRLVLDMTPRAYGGIGPHGLLIGCTGSGKSELLLSLVLGLAVEHGPEQVNFLLADAMGAATFDSVRNLPQVAGYFPNFSGGDDWQTSGGQMMEVVANEVSRRLDHIRSLGGFRSFSEYAWAARNAGVPTDPMPVLVVVIDEFAELMHTHRREFLDTATMVGRFGEAAGVHMLLASQRLEERVTHAIDSYLTYRICLNTFSANESREVLGVPDAYHLPSIPGRGLLRAPDGSITGFRAAYSSYRIRTRHTSDPYDDGSLPFSEVLATALISGTPARRLE